MIPPSLGNYCGTIPPNIEVDFAQLFRRLCDQVTQRFLLAHATYNRFDPAKWGRSFHSTVGPATDTALLLDSNAPQPGTPNKIATSNSTLMCRTVPRLIQSNDIPRRTLVNPHNRI